MLKQMYVGFIDPLARMAQGIFLGKKQDILQPIYSQLSPSEVKENAQKKKEKKEEEERRTKDLHIFE